MSTYKKSDLLEFGSYQCTKPTPAKKPPLEALPELTLVGRWFADCEEPQDGGHLLFAGCVRGDLGGGWFLIQFIEWIWGQLDTFEIRHIEKMVDWQFFEDHGHLEWWIKAHPNLLPR